jgi:hypothetical protein
MWLRPQNRPFAKEAVRSIRVVVHRPRHLDPARHRTASLAFDELPVKHSFIKWRASVRLHLAGDFLVGDSDSESVHLRGDTPCPAAPGGGFLPQHGIQASQGRPLPGRRRRACGNRAAAATAPSARRPQNSDLPRTPRPGSRGHSADTSGPGRRGASREIQGPNLPSGESGPSPPPSPPSKLPESPSRTRLSLSEQDHAAIHAVRFPRRVQHLRLLRRRRRRQWGAGSGRGRQCAGGRRLAAGAAAMRGVASGGGGCGGCGDGGGWGGGGCPAADDRDVDREGGADGEVVEGLHLRNGSRCRCHGVWRRRRER